MSTSDRETAALADLRRDIAVGVHARLPMAGSGGSLDLAAKAQQQLFGAGVLEPLLADGEISDVLVNGPGPVWIDRGQGVIDSGIRIDDERELRALAHRLVAACSRRLDDACPFADARLPDGTRVHAALPSVAPQGTTLSLRLPPRRVFSLDDLIALGKGGELIVPHAAIGNARMEQHNGWPSASQFIGEARAVYFGETLPRC